MMSKSMFYLPALFGLVALTALATSPARADGLTPVPPSDPDTQALYAQLHQDWWRWMASLPAENHPLTDATGENCHLGQTPGDWFLGGTYGELVENPTPTKQVGTAIRFCEVPAGEPIFFPILNINANNIGVDPPDDDAALEFIAALVDGLAARNVRLKLDGMEVPNVAANFHSESGAFTLDYVADSLIAPEAGSTRAAGAGTFCLLEPPTPGVHTIEFSGEYALVENVFGFEFEFELEVIYVLNVVAE